MIEQTTEEQAEALVANFTGVHSGLAVVEKDLLRQMIRTALTTRATFELAKQGNLVGDLQKKLAEANCRIYDLEGRVNGKT